MDVGEVEAELRFVGDALHQLLRADEEEAVTRHDGGPCPGGVVDPAVHLGLLLRRDRGQVLLAVDLQLLLALLVEVDAVHPAQLPKALEGHRVALLLRERDGALEEGFGAAELPEERVDLSLLLVGALAQEPLAQVVDALGHPLGVVDRADDLLVRVDLQVAADLLEDLQRAVELAPAAHAARLDAQDAHLLAADPLADDLVLDLADRGRRQLPHLGELVA